MTALFPALLPEELLYSVIARYRDTMRFANDRAVLAAIFGSPTGIAVVDLPGRLEALLAHLPPGHGYTAETIIRGHTTLPYYLRFVARHRAAEAVERLRWRGSVGLPDLLGIRASTVPSPTHLHFCPACAETDCAAYGAACWRRVHQLPGVLLCPAHQVPLWRSPVRRTQGEGRNVFRSLERDGRAGAQPIPVPDAGATLLRQLAADSWWLLSTPAEPEGLEGLRLRYRRLLEAHGWTRSAKQVRIGDLREAFLARYEDGMLALLGCGLATRTGEDDWLARLLRKPRAAQHPLHHLLVLRFLGLSPAEFFAGTPPGFGGGGPAPELRAPCTSPVCEPWEGRAALQRAAVPGTVRCERCGFTYRPPRGAGSRRVVLAYGPVWEGRLRALVADPRVSLKGAARTLGVDPRTLQRQARRLGVWREEWGTWEKVGPGTRRAESVRATTRRHRAAWLRLRLRHPGDGVQALRGRAPATYSHLYRYDRDWLDAHRPPRPRPVGRVARVDWSARDDELRALAEEAAAAMLRESERPVQIRVTTVARRMGQASLLAQHLDRLPLTAAYLNAVVETPAAFAIRKLRWAAEWFATEGCLPPAWKLVRRAALRAALAAELQEEIACALLHVREMLSVNVRAS